MSKFVEVSNQTFKLLFDNNDLDKMFASNILSKSDSIELIEGEIRKRIETCSDELLRSKNIALNLKKAFGKNALIEIQPSVQLHEIQTVKPSIAVLKASSVNKKTFEKDDLLFAIEITDFRYNHTENPRAIYFGRFGVSEVWFVIPNFRLVEVCISPGYGYSHCRTYRLGDTIKSETVPHLEIEVDKILGE